MSGSPPLTPTVCQIYLYTIIPENILRNSAHLFHLTNIRWTFNKLQCNIENASDSCVRIWVVCTILSHLEFTCKKLSIKAHARKDVCLHNKQELPIIIFRHTFSARNDYPSHIFCLQWLSVTHCLMVCLHCLIPIPTLIPIMCRKATLGPSPTVTPMQSHS